MAGLQRQAICICVHMYVCVYMLSFAEKGFKWQQHLHPFPKTDEGIKEGVKQAGVTGSTLPMTSLRFLTSCSCNERVTQQHAVLEINYVSYHPRRVESRAAGLGCRYLKMFPFSSNFSSSVRAEQAPQEVKYLRISTTKKSSCPQPTLENHDLDD